MPVSWDYFAKRRLKNRDGIRAWAESHGVTSYEELLEALNLDDVSPPSKDQVEFLFDPVADYKDEGVVFKQVTEDEDNDNLRVRTIDGLPADYGIYKEADEASEESL